MTDVSIRQLSKQHIINLRKQIKPHPLVEKVMKMVCILRGCIAPNWTMARELMNSMTFKLELMLMDPAQIKQTLVKKVLKILNSNQKQLTPIHLLTIDQGASILLTWVINFIKWNSGSTKY
jgi:hypoxanthine-guanine phosphoribosyltransferase